MCEELIHSFPLSHTLVRSREIVYWHGHGRVGLGANAARASENGTFLCTHRFITENDARPVRPALGQARGRRLERDRSPTDPVRFASAHGGSRSGSRVRFHSAASGRTPSRDGPARRGRAGADGGPPLPHAGSRSPGPPARPRKDRRPSLPGRRVGAAGVAAVLAALGTLLSSPSAMAPTRSPSKKGAAAAASASSAPKLPPPASPSKGKKK